VIEVRTSQTPALWWRAARTACLRDDFQAMVTAPLSKTAIFEAGLKDIGHTEILARVSGKQNLFMGFSEKNSPWSWPPAFNRWLERSFPLARSA